MTEDKLLILIDDLSKVNYYKKLGVTNFLFALKDYSIGYKSFSFDEIMDLNVNVYILLNRIINDKEIDEFLKKEIPKNIKGFIIEDLGLYMVLRDKGYRLINYQNHLNNNYKTVNINLGYFDSLVLNNDLTKEEMILIINKSIKPLCIKLFTRDLVLYSRKGLITNYYDYYGIDSDETNMDISFKDKDFIVYENEYGSCFFQKAITDYREAIKDFNDNKILFYIVEDKLIDNLKDFLNGKKYPNTTDSFLYKKTIYKVGGEKDGTT